jgi:WD40 repeat protein
MRLAVLVLTFMLMLSLHAWPAVAPDGESVYKGAVRSVMTLEVETTTGQRTGGTAFLAIRRGVAVTAWHVISDARRIKARFSDGRETAVTRILDVDEERDLAVLELADSGSGPLLRIATDDPPVGSRVYLLGAPEGLEFSISEGIVNQIRRLDGTKLIQYSAPTNPGNSGGPLLDAKGNVVGICVFLLRDSQNLNFAVKAWYATQMNTATDGPLPRELGSQPSDPNRPTLTLARNLEHKDQVNSAMFSPDGKMVVTACEDNTARLWDATNGREIRTLSGHRGTVESAVFSPNGKSIVTASWDNTARLWDTATGRELRAFIGHSSIVKSAAFSPDGNKVVTASWDTTARLWDASSGKEMILIAGHQDFVSSAAFSPDGKSVVTASADKTARLWDVATGKELRVLKGHSRMVSIAAFSPDGKTIVTASMDQTVRLWDPTTGRQLRTFTGHSGEIYSVAFSPDGKTIVTASWDETVRLWDVATAKEIYALTGHSIWFLSAVFAPDSKAVVTASYDNTVRIWPLPADLLRR